METHPWPETCLYFLLLNLWLHGLALTGPHFQVTPTLLLISSYQLLPLPLTPAEAWKQMQGHANQSLRVKTELQGAVLVGTRQAQEGADGTDTFMTHPGKHLQQQQLGSWVDKGG